MALIQERDVLARQRPRIMVVDAEPGQARQTVAALVQAGYDCRSFAEPELAIGAMEQGGAEVLVADLASERSTSELLRRVRANSPETAVILLVTSPSVSAAVAAMRQGAFDYLIKPINSDELTAVVGKALEMAALRRENRVLREQLDVASMAAAFIAESASSRHLAAMIRRAAPAHSPVMIEGESGTGKELVARMLHHWSSRAQGPFVRLSFKSFAGGEIGLSLAGELQRPHAGVAAMLSEYIEHASGGTLFLDEISEARPEFQSALLQLVAEGESSRGYARGRPLTVRIVSSTNRPLAREVAASRLRPDLYFALNVIAIQIAPLRERKEDILPLARHFLALHAAESGRSLLLTPEAEAALLAYSWPGNVRELENIIERAVVMSSGERISTEALMIRPQPAGETPVARAAPTAAKEEAEEPEMEDERAEAPLAQPQAGQGDLPMEGTLQEFLDRAASMRIKRAMDAASGNRNAAAAALGIDRTTLYRLMRRLGL
jgi:DNA-binding NtrC family response regulator